MVLRRNLLVTARIFLWNFLQSVYLQLGCFTILFDVFDDFQRHVVVPVEWTRQMSGCFATWMENLSNAFFPFRKPNWAKNLNWNWNYICISLTLTTRPNVPSPRVAIILSAMLNLKEKKINFELINQLRSFSLNFLNLIGILEMLQCDFSDWKFQKRKQIDF